MSTWCEIGELRSTVSREVMFTYEQTDTLKQASRAGTSDPTCGETFTRVGGHGPVWTFNPECQILFI